MQEYREQIASYQEAILMLLLRDWDWVFFNYLAKDNNFGIPERVILSFHYDAQYTVREIEVTNPDGGFWRVWSNLLTDIEDGRRVFLDSRSTPGQTTVRAYQPGRQVPGHIRARGVEFPWEGV